MEICSSSLLLLEWIIAPLVVNKHNLSIFRFWRCSSVVECLPNMQKSLGSIPSITKKTASFCDALCVHALTSRRSYYIIYEPEL